MWAGKTSASPSVLQVFWTVEGWLSPRYDTCLYLEVKAASTSLFPEGVEEYNCLSLVGGCRGGEEVAKGVHRSSSHDRDVPSHTLAEVQGTLRESWGSTTILSSAMRELVRSMWEHSCTQPTASLLLLEDDLAK